MPHTERPKVGQKINLCLHCARPVSLAEKSFRLGSGGMVHYVCYTPYKRVHPDRRPAA